ncbi:MAG: HPF/RaiA family ribosome-associated protein [Gammaproteobacteria bacterium]
MSFPIEIDFRNFERSEFVEAAVRERCEKLGRYSSEIIRCKVTVAAPHKHHAQGNLYQVSIDLHVPGTEIVINRDRGRNHSHEDVYVAMRDAFDAASRKLQDYVRVRRGKVKTHDVPPHGTVTELNSGEDYGRITSSDGRLIYFHRNSVVDADFDQLTIGSEVRFDEEAGDSGPQASSVRLIGKHHIVE